MNSFGDQFGTETLRKYENLFRDYRYSKYATYVTFQQAFRFSGRVQEEKVYFSCRNKLYGFKIEVSILSNGLAVRCSKHYPESTSD